jgi:nucleoside-diphosphate-sugar epimerase
VVPRFATALLDGRAPVIYGDGEQSRDFTYVDNAVAANLLAAEAEGVGGQTFNIACGETITVNAVLEHLREITGVAVEPVHEAARPGEPRQSLADISRARGALGYEPSVGFHDGLSRTLAALTDTGANAPRLV